MPVSLDTLRVAIVGSGPAGFFAAEALQKAAPEVTIDLFDRLPTPYGLVRGGVAPDHPKIKLVTRVFDRIASQPGFRFLGNVLVGRDVSVDELRERYHAVILTYGADTDRALGIPGETLPGSHAATEFVAWYNGNPDYAAAEFDLSQREVAIIGIGNVAMDVARILAKSPEALSETDLADHAMAALAESQVETIHLLARRGPVQAACTTTELRELGELEGVDVVVAPRDLDLDPASTEQLETTTDRNRRKNVEVLRGWLDRPSTGARRRVVFHFNTSPTAIGGDDRVEEITVVRNRLEPGADGRVRPVATDETATLPVGLVFRSVGYRGRAIEGVAFDDRRGVVANIDGRVLEEAGGTTPVPGLYAAGWIKRGPQGVIGTNKSCATETVTQLLADVEAGAMPDVDPGASPVEVLLSQRGVMVTDWDDWLRLDAEEKRRGEALGRPRVKITDVEEMLAVIEGSRVAT